MKKLFLIGTILWIVIIAALFFGGLKNDEGFYRTPFFLLLLAGVFGLTITCLLLRKKPSIDYWLIHSGLLVILAGALISFLGGFRQTVEIRERERQILPGTDLVIGLDDFGIKFYKDGQTPKEFKSSLSIFSHDQIVKRGECLVNHPVSCKGFKFYQQSYSPAEVSLRITSSKGSFTLREIGDEVSYPEAGLTLKLLDFLPDFVLDSSSNAFSRSEEFNNPAIKIAVCKNKETKESGWLFLKHKDFHHSSGKILSEIRFEEIVTTQYQSSLEVVKDHGAKIALLGSILLLIGLIRRLYLGK